MAGHTPFKELKDKMPPESRARVEQQVQKTLGELRLAEATEHQRFGKSDSGERAHTTIVTGSEQK